MSSYTRRSGLALLGVVAGVLGLLIATPLASVLNLSASTSRAWLAVPATVLLAMCAGLGPARSAARSTPINALRPAVRLPRRPHPSRGVVGMILSTAMRSPGRTLLGATALGLGVAACTVLIAVQRAFGGLVIGSLLGDAVVVQVRGADVAALASIGLLAALGVADVLYLTIREQATEFATLTAVGWPRWALRSLIIGHALVLGALGSLLGASVGGWVVGRFAGGFTDELVGPMVWAAGLGLVVAMLGSVVPGRLVGRLPVAALLSRED